MCQCYKHNKMHLTKGLSKLWQPVNGAGIEAFKKVFAILLILQVGGIYSADLVNKTFILPRTTIPFDFSDWIPVLPGKLIHIPFILQVIGALLLFTNKYSRLGALIYFLTFGYIFVLDISYYNNHFYFILLLCLLFTLYKPVKQKSALYVPKYLLYLFQFQVIVVYFYGGIVKLNPDWLLHQEPMREMLFLTNAHSWPESFVYVYTYGSILFDLSIGFLLLVPSTRKVAVIITILFHVLNHLMFSSGGNAAIGLFPIVMISTNLLFIDPEKIQQSISRVFPSFLKNETRKKSGNQTQVTLNFKQNNITLAFIVVYVLAQLTIPLRHFFIPGNVDWTGEGFYFSWRMKIRSKKVSNTIYVKSDINAKPLKVDPYTILNTLQYKMVCEHPAAMHHFVQYLKKTGKEKMGMKDPHFYLSWKCAMNGHPAAPVVDSTIDFGSLPHNKWGRDKWILPFN
jgi:vitamin K-dependent gamma-carboxylase